MCAPPTTAPADSLSAGARLTRVDCSAGTNPNRTPVNTDTASAKSKIRTSGAADRGSGASPAGIVLNSSRSLHTATASPKATPTNDSNRLSTINCRISRNRPAPSANRTAISLCRPVARAISRLATFAHAISSTSPTIAISTQSGFVT